VRLAIQRGEPGLNPKVNQLITLARRARHDLLVVSDSNVRVSSNYLNEIAAHFEDPSVGIVSHPIVASTSASVGATLDMLHLTTGIAPGVIATKRVARKDIVVGKSMAMRREDLEKIGGFEAVKDVLAEDFILGKMMPAMLHKRSVLAATPVENRATLKSVKQFFKRYQRWAVIHHHAVGLPLYIAELVLNPLALAALALIADASAQNLAIALTVGVFKLACDGFAARALTGRFLSLRALSLIPLKDALLFFAWLYGLFSHRIDWRGNSLLVLPGTLLQRPSEAQVPAEVMS
jgi:ceramide glucosyltransferase